MFVISLAFLRALEIQVNSSIENVYGCKITEKRPKALDQNQIVRTFLAQNNKHKHFISPKSYKTLIFKQIIKIFNSMTLNVQRIFRNHEKLHSRYCSVRGILYGLIKYFRPFQSFCKNEIFSKLDFHLFPVFVRRRGKLQNYLNLWTVQQILIHPNPSSTLDVMNFQKWELPSSERRFERNGNPANFPLVSSGYSLLFIYE